MLNNKTINDRYSLAVRVPFRRHTWGHLAIGVILLFLVALLSGAVGSVKVPPSIVAQSIVSQIPFIEVREIPANWSVILWEIRFPRIVLAGLVGAALALSGAVYQGLFRNALADPYLLGVASGAGLAATLVLTSRLQAEIYGFSILPLVSFVGSLLAVGVAYAVARQSNGTSRTTLILAGVAVASLAGAFQSLLLIRSDPDVRPVLAWLLGGFSGVHWHEVRIVFPYLLAGVLVSLAHCRILNVLQLDEDEAKQLGVPVERVKLILIATASLVTAAAVCVSGPIGFVGLIAPHAVRIISGYDYRVLLPMSLLLGSTFLILADLAARTMISPSELPVGVVTAFCGAPFFLYLLRRRGRLAA